MKLQLLAFLTMLITANSLVLGGEANIPKWEYKVWVQPDDIHAISRSAMIENKLNNLGAQGWELVSVTWRKHHDQTSPTGRMIYYFKRPAKAVAAPPKPSHIQYNGSNLSIEQVLERSKANWHLNLKSKQKAEQEDAAPKP
ncbi:DUF4177 domain-containing protein [Rubritalea squalenifaciens]|nr:DUF4177 domain-containing protein [Rubritalea squalenifaciens]